jgi:transposase-like protein DUF772
MLSGGEMVFVEDAADTVPTDESDVVEIGDVVLRDSVAGCDDFLPFQRDAVGWMKTSDTGEGAGHLSMRPLASPPVPVATAALARAVFPAGCLAMRLRDELGEVFSNADFTGAYPRRGGPALSPATLALVSVLQYAERLTDRQAAHAAAARIDWTYAVGLELADPGFDHRPGC